MSALAADGAEGESMGAAVARRYRRIHYNGYKDGKKWGDCLEEVCGLFDWLSSNREWPSLEVQLTSAILTAL
jgi:hypothetical protein